MLYFCHICLSVKCVLSRYLLECEVCLQGLIVLHINNKSVGMKGHNRNRSLLQERNKGHLHKHHQRSLSLNRYQSRQTHYAPLPYHEHLLSQSVTLPLSTEFYRQSHPKKIKNKQSLGHLVREKKLTKSKEKQSNSRKKKNKMKNKMEKQYGERTSFERRGQIGETKDHSKNKNSKQVFTKKKSREKGPSSSAQRKSFRKNTHEKIKKISAQITPKMGSDQKKNINEEMYGLGSEQVLDEYGHYLSSSEAKQIIEYKRIYFLGSISQRKTSKLLSLQKTLPKARVNGMISEKREDNNHLLEHINERYHEPEETLQTQNDFYKYQIGDHIAYRYQIIESINQGSFGEVLKVFDHKNQEYLALKIVKKNQQFIQQTFVEISILTQLKQKDRDGMSGVVKIKDFTIFRNHICIVFQLLNGNLYELLSANHFNGLSEEAVRIFAVQLLNSLNFLQREKIIHCDIKPENIMMKNWGKSGVKLIDFGTSCFEGKQMYEYLQSRYYRAPQVIMRRAYSYPIDMWSFGCLIAELKIGEPIFAGSTNVEQLLYMVNSIGWPEPSEGEESKHFLQSDDFQELKKKNYLRQYFKLKKTPEKLQEHSFFSQCKYLDQCMISFQQKIKKSHNFSNDDSLLDFLNRILTWQPERRLKPHEALQHPWVVKGLPNEIKDLYTIFNSCEYPQIKSKSKSSKNTSKNKSTSKSTKKHQEKAKMKEQFYNGRGEGSSCEAAIKMQRQCKSKTIHHKNNVIDNRY